MPWRAYIGLSAPWENSVNHQSLNVRAFWQAPQSQQSASISGSTNLFSSRPSPVTPIDLDPSTHLIGRER